MLIKSKQKIKFSQKGRKKHGKRKLYRRKELEEYHVESMESMSSFTLSPKNFVQRDRAPSLAVGSSIPGATRKRMSSLVSSYIYEVETARESGDAETHVRLLRSVENNSQEDILQILKGEVEPWDLIDFSSQTHVLHLAARFANKNTLDLLFKLPEVQKLVNTQDIRGTTPLIAAAWYNNIVATEYLLQRGAETRAKLIDSKQTALHCAADHPHDAVVKAILKYNKNKDFLDSVDKEGNTALMIAVAADSPCIDVLFKAGTDYTKQNFITGRNILHQAIVNGNYPLIKMLVSECFEKEFLDTSDHNGDTPLTIAIRLDDDEAIEILLRSRHAEMVLPHAQLCLHMLLNKGKARIFIKLLEMIKDKTYFNFADQMGRAVILYAVELNQYIIFNAMISAGVDYMIRNHKTGETIIHVAAYVNNPVMLKIIFKLEDIRKLMEVKDHSGSTASEVVLGRSDRSVWRQFVRYGFLSFRYCNESKESCLFIAAKKGNCDLVISILFSEKFNHLYETVPIPLKKRHLVKLELQGLIYTSDLYLLTGIVYEERKWQVCPNQEDLFQFNDKGQNIFHACTTGKNINCLTLIYEYCLHYNKAHIENIDRPDNDGNTPLMYALKIGSNQQIIKYLMKKGADLSKKNKSNQTALDVMIGTLPDFQSLLTNVINECVIFDNTSYRKNKQYDEMKIVHDVICPSGIKQMAVLDLIFSRLRGKKNIAIIQSPVIEYFVLYKWNRIEQMVGFRFVMFSLLVVLFSTYISFTFCKFLAVYHLISKVIAFFILVLTVMMTCFSIPLIFFTNKHFLCKFIIISAPLLILIFLLMGRNSRLTLEVGAAGVLFSWLAILILGSVTKMSFQIAMFSEVVKHITGHLPMCLIILYAFSHCCFLLFHDFYSFNNPFQSFITTSILLVHGENELPVFNPELYPMGNKTNLYKVVDYDTGLIDGKAELRGIMVEGTILLLFHVLINICFLNMLVGLAVRSGEELELEGNMNRARTYIDEIFAWETFVQSSFYKFAKEWNVLWLMGVPRDLEEQLSIPTVHTPLSDSYVPPVNLHRLRQIAKLNTQIPKTWIPMGKEVLSSDTTQLEVEGIVRTLNITWIYNEKQKTLLEPTI